ncbi:MAG: rRNA pseudouridine synthase [Lentisphaerae bacterium]|nr:rRNA pseudouridine synthase [Lentisphaerota bacterium]
MMNLVKYLSNCGAASRRKSEELIRSGHVAVDGNIECDPAFKVAENMAVMLDGVQLSLPEMHHYILLHKPRGYVCSNADAHAEKLAVELIDIPGVRLVSAGRLDKESEGAIIFSDDGEFINFLAHPRYGVLKRYEVFTVRPITLAWQKKMVSGITDEGENLKVIAIKELEPCRYEITLNEGKKREIRRLTAAAGAPTRRLIRKSIGKVELGKLPCGKYRELSADEVRLLLTNTN